MNLLRSYYLILSPTISKIRLNRWLKIDVQMNLIRNQTEYIFIISCIGEKQCSSLRKDPLQEGRVKYGSKKLIGWHKKMIKYSYLNVEDSSI